MILLFYWYRAQSVVNLSHSVLLFRAKLSALSHKRSRFMSFPVSSQNKIDKIMSYPVSSQNKIDKIQSRQEAKVEERIREQFEMEQLVFTQDSIYFKTLKKATAPVEGDASTVNCAEFDSRSKYPEMLQAYYEVQYHHCV